MNDLNKRYKVGVITFYRYNYGGFLQAYALQRTLGSLGYDAELIQYDYLHDRTILGVPFSEIKKPVIFIKRLLVSIIRNKQNKLFWNQLAASAKKHLKESKRYTSASQIQKIQIEYNICITGSDQVFNPLLHPQGFKIRMLDFGDEKIMKRFSYAASVGRSELPAKWESYFCSRIAAFDAISVREAQAYQTLAKYTDMPVTRHLDPTFLLSKADWIRFSEELPDEVTQPFIFVHILKRQEELIQFAEQLSQSSGYKILMSDGRCVFKNTIRLEKPLSPEQFIRAVSEAKYIITNSFHGSALAIRLNQRVRIFLPDMGGERISEILELLGLTRLTLYTIISHEDLKRLYADAEDIIEHEKQRAIEYLQSFKNT